MNQKQHTPGPWTYDPKTGLIGYDQSDDLSPVVAAHQPHALTSDEQLANFYLIAAAPEMLAALEAAHNFPWVANTAHTDDIEALRATCLAYSEWNNKVVIPLVAKARGRTECASCGSVTCGAECLG